MSEIHGISGWDLSIASNVDDIFAAWPTFTLKIKTKKEDPVLLIRESELDAMEAFWKASGLEMLDAMGKPRPATSRFDQASNTHAALPAATLESQPEDVIRMVRFIVKKGGK